MTKRHSQEIEENEEEENEGDDSPEVLKLDLMKNNKQSFQRQQYLSP
jgi:hypothetical protein